MIAVEDVLVHFTAATNAPSSMGSQLDRLAVQSEAKRHGPGWITHAKPTSPTHKDPDGAILKDAELYRCVGDLGRMRSAEIDTAGTLVDVAVSQGHAIGNVLVRTLRAFQSALASPTDEELERATKRADKATSARRAEVLQRALAEYRAPRGLEAIQRCWDLSSSGQAADLYADCLLVLSLFLQQFNRRGKA